VNLDHGATEEPAKMAIWSRDSLEYAHDCGQRKIIWLLEAVRDEVQLEDALLALPWGEHLGSKRNISSGREKVMNKNQGVAEMSVNDLARQAGNRANRTGEPFDKAPKSVLETEAGRQLGELRDGPHRNEKADQWQKDLVQQRTRERKREQAEEKNRAQRAAAWERFMQEELRELELRKGGQLARLLGEPLPEEPPAALERLALEDQRQAEEGLVALMSGGKVSYKHLDELSEKDMPARIAANRLRTTWLKERQDRWLGHGEESESRHIARDLGTSKKAKR
jgi:hypothetical protein